MTNQVMLTLTPLPIGKVVVWEIEAQAPDTSCPSLPSWTKKIRPSLERTIEKVGCSQPIGENVASSASQY